MAKRILTITSGKGGVGKTTLAINLGLALSRYGRTVLIDQDFETGSVRSFLDLKFEYDLYHFMARDRPLADCVVRMPRRWDPAGHYQNFGVIAAPRHFIDDLARVRGGAQEKLARALDDLPADIVLLDMKAGLGQDVVDSMPYSNSGILIFTPRLPAATGAAANLIKAQIFRKLQLTLKPPSPLLSDLETSQVDLVTRLLLKADDVYDEEVGNLDQALDLLAQELGDHPVVRAFERTLATFHVHYVLNHFDGLENTYDKAVKPFVSRLVQIVSSRLQVHNLGWIELNPEIHDANCQRVPALLYRDVMKRVRDEDRLESAMEELERVAREGLSPEVPEESRGRSLEDHLDDQLHQLDRMYRHLDSVGFQDHFRFLSAATAQLLATGRSYSFGDTGLHSPESIHRKLVRYQRKIQRKDG